MPGSKEFDAHSERLTFVFGSKEAANFFKQWLCEMGEQDYWDCMEIRESETEGPITGLSFNYHTGTDEIPVECGRLNRDETP